MTGQGAKQNAIVVGTRLPTNRFTHVVATCDGSNLRVYLDGDLAATGNIYADIADNGAPAIWGSGWRGDLDELAVYDRALTLERVRAHWEAARP